MKIVSIDIETTGLDPETCQVIQIGAVIEDTANIKPLENLPKYKCLIEHKNYSGSARALHMNAGILNTIADLDKQKRETAGEYRIKHNIITPTMAAASFSNWLTFNGCELSDDKVVLNVAGKNFASFDKLFLEKLPNWKARIKIRNRILDPAILAINWKEDSSVPGLALCKKRAGLEGHVSHDALDDALDVIRILRVFTNNYQNESN
jgi:oligoribonuclease (3'-5' exoribonuclease)